MFRFTECSYQMFLPSPSSLLLCKEVDYTPSFSQYCLHCIAESNAYFQKTKLQNPNFCLHRSSVLKKNMDIRLFSTWFNTWPLYWKFIIQLVHKCTHSVSFRVTTIYFQPPFRTFNQCSFDVSFVLKLNFQMIIIFFFFKDISRYIIWLGFPICSWDF